MKLDKAFMLYPGAVTVNSRDRALIKPRLFSGEREVVEWWFAECMQEHSQFERAVCWLRPHADSTALISQHAWTRSKDTMLAYLTDSDFAFAELYEAKPHHYHHNPFFVLVPHDPQSHS